MELSVSSALSRQTNSYAIWIWYWNSNLPSSTDRVAGDIFDKRIVDDTATAQGEIEGAEGIENIQDFNF